jgi:phosphate transport system substrate-binding protein
MACTTYDDANTAALVKGYLNFIISQPGQQAAASAAGSAPISAALTAKIQPAVDAIGS